jgi:nitroreductase
MEVFKAIKTRRSIRRFRREEIPLRMVRRILEAGRWAPSGLNNQPWRFKIVGGDLKNELAKFTHYSSIVRGADKLILVFLDKESSYHRDKDLLSIGACIQNMLLYIHSQGLGACWLGEILNKKREIHKFLGTFKNLELVGVVALGVPLIRPKRVGRKKLEDLILK